MREKVQEEKKDKLPKIMQNFCRYAYRRARAAEKERTKRYI